MPERILKFLPEKKNKKHHDKKYENEPEKTSLPKNNLKKVKSMRDQKIHP